MHNNSTSDPVRCERQRVMDSPSIKILADYMYHQLMNDVDLHDQLRKKYASVRPSKKYWMFILWFVLDCCRVNAYIVYKEAWSRTIRNKRYTHLDFVIELGGAIIRNFTSRKRVCIRESLAPVFVEYNCVNHVFFFAWTGNAACAKDVMCSVFAQRLWLGVLLVAFSFARPATLQGTELEKITVIQNVIECDEINDKWILFALNAILDLYTLFCNVYVLRFEHLSHHKKLYNWLFDISVDQSHEVAEDAHSS